MSPVKPINEWGDEMKKAIYNTLTQSESCLSLKPAAMRWLSWTGTSYWDC